MIPFGRPEQKADKTIEKIITNLIPIFAQKEKIKLGTEKLFRAYIRKSAFLVMFDASWKLPGC